jgi:DNA-binding IclR family transcriptional regulator
LTRSQAACLAALRQPKSQTEIALRAGLDLVETAAALARLEELGLAGRGEKKGWHPSARGMNCRFETVPDQNRRDVGRLRPSGRHLLELLERPMRGDEIALKLGVTRQRVHQLLVQLHAQGRVRFGGRNPLIVAHSDDETLLLSRDEERVLSRMPEAYATDATKIKAATGLPTQRARRTLERLVNKSLIATLDGFKGDTVYRITAAGLQHPQRHRQVRRAKPPRLPVESDRIRAVLSTMREAGSLRIKELRDALNIPQNSINALMQYLKRKGLVQKTGWALFAPYALTDQGRQALAEMMRRQAA